MAESTTHELVLAALIPAEEREEFDRRVAALVVGNDVLARAQQTRRAGAAGPLLSEPQPEPLAPRSRLDAAPARRRAG